ncbi:MAG: DUF354 domain-containing protein [Patescibacteria group bacterium]
MINNNVKIVFRVDGNKKIGLGHLSRCLALSHEIKRRINCDILFLMKDYSDVRKEVLKHGCKIESRFPKGLVDIFITSVPNVSQKYLAKVKERARLVVVMDDSARTQYSADIVVKSSLAPELNKFSQKSKSKFLIGPDYMMLNKEFQRLNLRKKKINPEIKSILITMGGSDVNNLTPKIMEALDKLTNIKKTVIVGPVFEKKAKLKTNNGYNLKYGVSNMAELMFSSDLAIVGGGTTLYELACVGTPGIVLCQTNFQLLVAKCFEKKGAIVNLISGRNLIKIKNEEKKLGLSGNLTKETIISNVKFLMKNEEKRKKMSFAGKKIVDGKGVVRVVDKILSAIK